MEKEPKAKAIKRNKEQTSDSSGTQPKMAGVEYISNNIFYVVLKFVNNKAFTIRLNAIAFILMCFFLCIRKF